LETLSETSWPTSRKTHKDDGQNRKRFSKPFAAPGASRASYLCDGRLYPGDAG